MSQKSGSNIMTMTTANPCATGVPDTAGSDVHVPETGPSQSSLEASLAYGGPPKNWIQRVQILEHSPQYFRQLWVDRHLQIHVGLVLLRFEGNLPLFDVDLEPTERRYATGAAAQDVTWPEGCVEKRKEEYEEMRLWRVSLRESCFSATVWVW
jgi:hypothetical protein